MRLVDVMLSFPDLITGLLVMAVLGSGQVKLIVAIGLTIAPRFARIAYGPTLALKEKEFVEAARALGQSSHIILSRHILPNIAGELLVLGSLWTASAIRLEASLSFIGPRRAAAHTDLGADDSRWHPVPRSARSSASRPASPC